MRSLSCSLSPMHGPFITCGSKENIQIILLPMILLQMCNGVNSHGGTRAREEHGKHTKIIFSE
jgi:hypothetical protein